MKTENFVAEDKKNICLHIWDDCEAVGVVQLLHGMAETAERYDDFANYLNKNGYIVVADDHRAHGKTDENALGLAGEGDIFAKTVKDEKDITKLISERYNLPVVLLGHSYGSFLAQSYISAGASEICGVILSGSADMRGVMVNFGYKIADGKCRKGKADEAGTFFSKQTFVRYDRKIRDGINGWLSRDIEQVGRYNVNNQCGFTCSNGFYKYFFAGLKSIAKDNGEKIDKNLRMLIASGVHDYVGGCGKLVNKLAEKYKNFGLSPVLRLYDGARHEILNEINKSEVYEDFLAFIKGCTGR